MYAIVDEERDLSSYLTISFNQSKDIRGLAIVTRLILSNGAILASPSPLSRMHSLLPIPYFSLHWNTQTTSISLFSNFHNVTTQEKVWILEFEWNT